MKRKFPHHPNGQAFAELAIIMTVLLVIAFGTIEFGRMISLSSRMATVARETGRMINAQEYDPTEMENTFGVATNMISPANLETEGRIIVSFVQRAAGDLSDFYTSTPSDTNRDYLVIVDRFYYPYSGSDPRTPAGSGVTNWTTKLPVTFDNGTTNTSTRRFIPFSNNVGPVVLDMLSPSGKTAVVEVFHTNKLIAPLKALGLDVPDYLYDSAAF